MRSHDGQPASPHARPKRLRRPLPGLLAVVLPLLLAACTPGAPLSRTTVTLIPSDVVNHYFRDRYRYNGGGCPFSGPDMPISPPAGRMAVGADNSFDGGTDPFPCITKEDYGYRGGVRFNVSGIQRLDRKVIEKAVLSWTIESSIVRDADGNASGVASGRDVTNCVDELLESSRSIQTEGAFLPGRPYRSGQGDVTGLVTSWIVNGDPNFGFVLIGVDESNSRNSAACVSIVKNLKLTITYLHS